MKRSVITALGAAVIAMLGASSAAQAALINFTVTAIDGTPGYVGTTLDQSISVNVDTSILLVSEVGAGDSSGLTPGDDTVSLSPTDIVYGAGTGPSALSGSGLTKSWTGDNGDVFVETLTAVDSINRLTPDQVIVHLSGTVSDSQGLFVDTPAFFVLNATQFDGGGTATSVTFTNSAGAVTPSAPEPSTWVMMTLGFGVLGYAAFRRREANVAALFP
jgi:PEP-CTERM motif